MTIATFVERYQGTEFVSRYIYGSVWFCILWGGLALSSFIVILSWKMYSKQISLFLLHVSFLVILCGALLTFLTAKRGYIHLRVNEENRTAVVMEKDKEMQLPLPIALTLNNFRIDYYPGTDAPLDYVSQFTVKENNGNSFVKEVSMNRIFSYQGIRLYQSSYDNDNQGSTLIVNIDKWGTPVTYAGYFMLIISMIWVLFSPNGKMRKLLKHPLLKKGIMFLTGLFVLSINTLASPQAIPQRDVTKLGEVQVFYNNRIAPLQTLAFDFTKKIVGKQSYKAYSPEQFLAGWIFNPGLWKYEPCIKVKSAEVRKKFNLKEYASLTDFFDNTSTYIFEAYWKEQPQGKPDKLHRSVSELDEKVQLILMISKGELLKIFPVTRVGKTIWCNSTAQLPDDVSAEQRIFVKKIFALLNEYIVKKDSQQFQYSVAKLIEYQQQNGEVSVLSSSKLKAELLYNRIPFVTMLYRFNLVMGLVILILWCIGLIREKPLPHSKLLFQVFTVALSVTLIFLTFCIGLRTYISGRWPMGNGFETMVFLAWCILLITLLFYRKFRLIIPFGYLLSGFFLLVASFSLMNPQITSLVPVLSSPLLSIHVSTIMISYALLAFTFLSGLTSLILYGIKNKKDNVIIQIEGLQLMSQLFLIPGLFFLGGGVFLGAIWANISWGRYWAWDPKEVWALITFLFYSVVLHSGSLKIFRKPLFFHTYMCIAFLTILMTYFGVNYILGGLHSYA